MSGMRKPSTLDGEREKFEKNQTISIQKAISPTEAAAKEKHIRSAILGTYQEKGAHTFWHVARRLPLSSNSVICWKFCHVLHKLLRDGHPHTLSHSAHYKSQIKDLSKLWGHVQQQGYGKLILVYTKLLLQRMEFHKKYADFPGNLMIEDGMLEKIANNDINAFFELSVDLFDYLDALMDTQLAIFRTIDQSRSVSTTDSGQCRLAPCIPIILDSSQLYDYIVKLLFKMHACLPADTLSGHRQRFIDNYNKLKKFYFTCSNMQYFKALIQVPMMPDTPPNFLLISDGSHELGPVKMVPEVEAPRTPSPEPLPVVENLIDTSFNDTFGDFSGPFQFDQVNGHDPKDDIIAELRAEIQQLKSKIEMMRSEHMGEIRSLLDRIVELERELETALREKREFAEERDSYAKKLKDVEFKLQNAGKAQHHQLQEIEKRSAGFEEMYKKMKDKYLQLGKDHAELLRKNAETRKQAEHYQQSVGESESEKARLLTEAEELKASMLNKEREEEERKRKEQEERFALLVSTVEEVEQMVREAVDLIDDPVNAQNTCNAETLICTVENARNTLQRVDNTMKDYVNNDDVTSLLRALQSFGHNLSQTIINGSATCHMAPEDQRPELDTSCRSCGKDTLDFLAMLKEMRSSDGSKHSIDSKEVEEQLSKMLAIAQDLLPKMIDVAGGDLHDMVEQEMSSTSRAIEQAAERIEDMLRAARERDSGINLEVNERILDSCTNLMQMIRILIQSSKELQREIVDTGRGASSTKEFYMKNSRWTEGLISAAKAVGWGATVLTDAADHVVQGDGKFEELIVCSHEIAASTAQLVAASRVKADKTSGRLGALQKASKNVNGATANVVASTKSGQQQIDDTGDSMDQLASAMTLTQIKRKEMDSQVKLLELEQALKDERMKLGSLRRKHYELAEVQEKEYAAEVEVNKNLNNNSNNEPPKPALKPKPTLPAKPMLQ